MSVAGRKIAVLTCGCGFALRFPLTASAHGLEDVLRPPPLTAIGDTPPGAEPLLNAVVVSQAASLTSLLETIAGLLKVSERLVPAVCAKRGQTTTAFLD